MLITLLFPLVFNTLTHARKYLIETEDNDSVDNNREEAWGDYEDRVAAEPIARRSGVNFRFSRSDPFKCLTHDNKRQRKLVQDNSTVKISCQRGCIEIKKEIYLIILIQIDFSDCRLDTPAPEEERL